MLSTYATAVHLVFNCHPNRVLQPIANPSLIYTKKVKTHKLQYKMWKHKEGMRRSKLLDTRMYPVVLVGTKDNPSLRF